MKLIITGATGTAGAECLRQALLDERITLVTVLSRRALPPHIAPSPPSSKLRCIQHSDFTSYPPSLLAQLRDHDACIWALGHTSQGISERDYEVITVDYALAAAQAFEGLERTKVQGRDKFVFAYVSGQGADQREGKASMMFGRVKGKAEHLLAGLPTAGHPSLAPFSFRPAGILPIHPVPDAPWFYKGPFLPVMRGIGTVFPSTAVRTDVLAKGLIEVCLKGGTGEVKGWKGRGEVGNEGVFKNEEIKLLAMGREKV
ncbi:hypothetical protein JCM11641_007728 [Rhodosporidiobolus odoratus]